MIVRAPRTLAPARRRSAPARAAAWPGSAPARAAAWPGSVRRGTTLSTVLVLLKKVEKRALTRARVLLLNRKHWRPPSSTWFARGHGRRGVARGLWPPAEAHEAGVQRAAQTEHRQNHHDRHDHTARGRLGRRRWRRPRGEARRVRRRGGRGRRVRRDGRRAVQIATHVTCRVAVAVAPNDSAVAAAVAAGVAAAVAARVAAERSELQQHAARWRRELPPARRDQQQQQQRRHVPREPRHAHETVGRRCVSRLCCCY